MTIWRSLFHSHRRFALLLVLCALFVKALVPAGYMIGSSSKTLTVQVCTDGLGTQATKTIEIPMEGGSHDPTSDADKAFSNCGFSSLAMGGMPAADALQLGLALVFILLLGFAPTLIPRVSRAFHIRPPLRGPPTAA